MSAPASSRAKGPGCAICGRPIEAAFRPFCSRRCADVDLNRWMSGVYAIPADEGRDDDADPVTGRPASHDQEGSE